MADADSRPPSRRGRRADAVELERLTTGVPGLDRVLHGGIPRLSFNIVAGTPGAGKTTIAQQIAFAQPPGECTTLYVTVLGEPTVKMLRYQQQFDFFDPERIGEDIHYLNLGEETLNEDVDAVIDRILAACRRHEPDVVVVDSFRSFARTTHHGRPEGPTLQRQVQRLALELAAMRATAFLIGEYPPSSEKSNPVFTVADGILWLYQPVDKNAATRQLRVVKMRGTSMLPGLHTVRIDGGGVRVFPRGYRPERQEVRARFARRLSTGVSGLDDMLEGGIPEGEAVLLAGPSGSGKSTLALHFAAEGIREGERVVVAVFEERPEGYMARARTLGLDLERLVEEGRAEVLYLRGLDLSVDETLFELYDAVERLDASRVIVDSLSGLEVALAPAYEADFRETLYNLAAFLTDHGVTLFMTVETVERFNQLLFTPNAISLISDTLIVQRYAELNGRLEKVMTVVKMRHSSHSTAVRRYEVGAEGIRVHETMEGYRHVVTGVPVPNDH